MGLFDYSVRHLLGASYQGGGLCFSGSTLHVSVNGRVTSVDLREGRARTLPYESTRALRTLSSSDNGLLLAVNAYARAALIQPSGAVRGTLAVPIFNLTAGCISPDGRLVAFANATDTTVWRTPAAPVPGYAEFERFQNFRAGASAPAAMAWSDDSRRLAVAGRDGVCRVFTMREATGRRKKLIPLVLHGHREPIVVVKFCGKRGLVTISRDGAMFCWRLRFNDDIARALEEADAAAAAAAKKASVGNDEDEGDSDEIASESEEKGEEKGAAKIESESESDSESDSDEDGAIPGMLNRGWFLPLEAALLSRHFVKKGAKRIRSGDVSQNLAVIGMSNGVFALYKLPEEMGEAESEDFDKGLFELRQNVIDERKELKKRKKLSGDDNDSDKPQMQFIGFTELNLVHSLSVSAGALTDVKFNDTGEWIALASSHSGQLVVWEWRSETHVLKQQSHVLSSSAAAFSADGRAIATGSLDGRLKLWGVTTGFCAATFADHTAAVTGIAFAGSDVVVSSSLDGTVRAFDIRRYRNFRVLVGPPPQRQFGCVAVDEAGDLVAAGCVDTFEVVVWSLRTGKVLELLAGHKGPVASLAFRPRRGTLASGSWDRTVRLWDMYERKGSCETLEHSKEVLAVTFRPDGREFASASLSGEITLWDAEKGTVTGTIDGGRDAAPGRSRDSRTLAPVRGHFQTLSYSADGRFLLAGAASKSVCVYIVAEGITPSLVDKHNVTRNQDFDGLRDELNSKNVTVSGHNTDFVDHDDEEAESYGEAVIARGKSQPGAMSEALTKRKKLLKAEVKCVRYSPAGRMWAAVTQEGVLLYGEGAYNGQDEIQFDPVNLAVDITPKTAERALKERQFVKALMIALRLSERGVLNKVVEAVPAADVPGVLSSIPSVYFVRLVTLLAWRIENTPHIELNLLWARRLLLQQGGHAHDAAKDIGMVNTVLRSLHRVTTAQSKKVGPLADRNQHTLQYLTELSTRSS